MTGRKRPKTDSLSPRQAVFVAALVGGASKQEAAARAGISDRCGRRWLGLPLVKRALEAAMDEALGVATRRTVGAMARALDTLEAICGDENQPAGSRVAAAGRILDSGPKLREALDLAVRVAALEDKLEVKDGCTEAG